MAINSWISFFFFPLCRVWLIDWLLFHSYVNPVLSFDTAYRSTLASLSNLDPLSFMPHTYSQQRRPRHSFTPIPCLWVFLAVLVYGPMITKIRFQCGHVCTFCYSIVVWLGISSMLKTLWKKNRSRKKELSAHHVMHSLSLPSHRTVWWYIDLLLGK